MYERMFNKKESPSMEEMTAFCSGRAEGFSLLNQWLISHFKTEWKIVFPYGSHYGWAIAHKRKNKLICNIFPENGAFTVMIRLSNTQYKAVYEELHSYTQECINRKYPCGDGGWIQYRVLCSEHFEDIQKLLSIKCS